MRKELSWVVSLAASVSMGCSNEMHRPGVPPVSSEHLEIQRAHARPSTKGSRANFTGTAMVTQLFGATDGTRATGGSVSFEPGARSVWHSHPAGQTLIVTSGTGWVQEWGGKKQEIRQGDVVWTPPGVKHWHGATATEGMSHIAIQEQVDGNVVTWMDPVTDEQYRDEERPK